MRFEREQGYFIGAIYVNYAFTIAVSLGGVLVIDALFPLPLAVQLAIGVTSAVVIPLLGFRHARSLWLALGTSQRTVQRALDALAAAGKVQSFGRGRARRWTTQPVPGFTTTLILPAPLPID